MMMMWSIVGGLVLYFDGSLRPPRDSCFPIENLGRMASCGAAILSLTDGAVLALGGKSIELHPHITAQEAEWEGLLLGLDFLDNRREWRDDEELLIIRGDCKTIIDQLKGSSTPRKMMQSKVAASKLLGGIEKRVNVSFEHVVRKKNGVCDTMCALVMDLMETRQVQRFRREMVLLQESSTHSASDNSALSDILKRFVSSGDSIVRYSLRPNLYKEAVSISEHISDGKAIDHIGQQLFLESKFWSNNESMAVNGILLQARGQRLQGLDKEAARLLRKHRYLLRRFPDHVTWHNMETPQSVFDSYTPHFDDNASEGMLRSWCDQAGSISDSDLFQGYWITRSEPDVC